MCGDGPENGGHASTEGVTGVSSDDGPFGAGVIATNENGAAGGELCGHAQAKERPGHFKFTYFKSAHPLRNVSVCNIRETAQKHRDAYVSVAASVRVHQDGTNGRAWNSAMDQPPNHSNPPRNRFEKVCVRRNVSSAQTSILSFGERGKRGASKFPEKHDYAKPMRPCSLAAAEGESFRNWGVEA